MWKIKDYKSDLMYIVEYDQIKGSRRARVGLVKQVRSILETIKIQKRSKIDTATAQDVNEMQARHCKLMQ